jgi:hypothetical protein
VRRNGGRTIEALKVQQMAACVHDGNAHRPIVFLGFGLSGCGNGLHVGQFENGLCFHGVNG